MRKLASILNSPFVGAIRNGAVEKIPVVDAVEATESPIEAQLMAHITRYDFVIGQAGLTIKQAIDEARGHVGRIVVFPQAWIGDYRPDFLFLRASARGVTALVAEADGKDWHYSDKRQIAHDNLRLATFAKHRVFTMRFLGREIWKECGSVIAHIREFFDGAA